jgi:hypothetical protein
MSHKLVSRNSSLHLSHHRQCQSSLFVPSNLPFSPELGHSVRDSMPSCIYHDMMFPTFDQGDRGIQTSWSEPVFWAQFRASAFLSPGWTLPAGYSRGVQNLSPKVGNFWFKLTALLAQTWRMQLFVTTSIIIIITGKPHILLAQHLLISSAALY